MPYIKQKDRDRYNYYIDLIGNELIHLPQEAMAGHINYIITKLLQRTVPVRYNDYNTLIGLLECTKLELYRRKIAPYEDKKIEQNGDVY